jgi:hypothetical protein
MQSLMICASLIVRENEEPTAFRSPRSRCITSAAGLEHAKKKTVSVCESRSFSSTGMLKKTN